MKIMKIIKNVEPILNITKNLIKKSDNFNDYYIREKNNLFENQLPLLMHKSRIREILLYKKLKREDIDTFEKSSEIKEDEEEEEKKRNYSLNLLSRIRRLHTRSKKLPPLCPFYSNNGDLLPEVIATSKIYNRSIAQTEGNNDINISISTNSLGKYTQRRRPLRLSPLNLKMKRNFNFNKILEINFDEFQKEILFESKYESLKYDNSEIFGHKEFYQEFVKGLVEEISILTGEDENNINLDKETKKEKIFEWGKNKRNIILTLNTLQIKIKEIKEETDNNDNEDNKENKNNNNSKDDYIFEYSLPINLIPLFYYKGFDKFKIFINCFIRWDEEKEKFELNENFIKSINNLLLYCKDLKLKKEGEEDIEIDDSNLLQPYEMKKSTGINNKFNMTKSEKSSTKNFQIFNPMARSTNFGAASMQNSLFAGTNVDIIAKKRLKKSKFNLYQKEKKSTEFINYNHFEFYWNTSKKMFSVTIETPLITFSIPSYDIMIKQFIDFELLFYLFKINFESWDFYIIKYLSSFKLFRILLSQLTSVKPKTNINFFLEKYKSRSFNCTDCKIINIITSKILAENNEVVKKSKKKSTKIFNFSKTKLRKNEIKEENDKEDVDTSNNNTISNNSKREEIEKMKQNKLKEEEKNKETHAIPTTQSEEADQSLKIINTNIRRNNNNNNTSIESNGNIRNYNLIIEQKCFMAIVTFMDIEKAISNQYTIHFNYAHFTKFKSMEKYMKKSSFLLKFIDINYENSTIKFDYEALNAFNEEKWIKEVEKYNFKYESESKIENNDNINKEEQKLGSTMVNSINRAEYAGAIKGTSITIEIKSPIILLRSIDKLGKISTKPIHVLEDEEQRLNMTKNINSLILTKNIVDISMKHNTKEIEDISTKKLADNILLNAFKKNSNNKSE
jgi:hypothetical protein